MAADQGVSAALLAEVRELRMKLDELGDDLQHALRRLLTPEDQRELRKLLPLIRALQGDQVWSASSLFADALEDQRAEALRAALFDWVDPRGGLRSLGRFLERCAGSSSAGLRLVRVGRPSTGALYVVQLGPGRAKSPTASQARPRGAARC
jgi:hypothetical protein